MDRHEGTSGSTSVLLYLHNKPYTCTVALRVRMYSCTRRATVLYVYVELALETSGYPARITPSVEKVEKAFSVK